MASKAIPNPPSTGAKPVDPLAGFDEERLRARFASLDINHDGTISKEELKQVIKDLKLPFSKGDAGRILKQMDQDGSGAIDFEVRPAKYNILFLVKKIIVAEADSVSFEHFRSLRSLSWSAAPSFVVYSTKSMLTSLDPYR
jgi:hypothetical protein